MKISFNIIRIKIQNNFIFSTADKERMLGDAKQD